MVLNGLYNTSVADPGLPARGGGDNPKRKGVCQPIILAIFQEKNGRRRP